MEKNDDLKGIMIVPIHKKKMSNSLGLIDIVQFAVVWKK